MEERKRKERAFLLLSVARTIKIQTVGGEEGGGEEGEGGEGGEVGEGDGVDKDREKKSPPIFPRVTSPSLPPLPSCCLPSCCWPLPLPPSCCWPLPHLPSCCWLLPSPPSCCWPLPAPPSPSCAFEPAPPLRAAAAPPLPPCNLNEEVLPAFLIHYGGLLLLLLCQHLCQQVGEAPVRDIAGSLPPQSLGL